MIEGGTASRIKIISPLQELFWVCFFLYVFVGAELENYYCCCFAMSSWNGNIFYVGVSWSSLLYIICLVYRLIMI